MQTRQKRKRQLTSGLMVCICALACNNVENKSTMVPIETAYFSIELPSTKFGVVYSQDSMNGKLVSSKDTVYFNIGFDINTLTEKEPKVLYVPFDRNKRLMVDARVVDTAGLVYAEREDYDMDEYRKQNVFFTNSNGLFLKNTFPRKAYNDGIVGVYCDSLMNCFVNRLKFSIYKKGSGNLSYDSLYLKSFSTIRFKKRPMCY